MNESAELTPKAESQPTLPATTKSLEQKVRGLEETQLKISTVLTQLNERLVALEKLKNMVEEAGAKIKDSPLASMFGNLF
jgi:hypothetical protein